jgi:hypothetical protein
MISATYQHAYIDDITATLVGDGGAISKPFMRFANPDGLSGNLNGWTTSSGATIATSAAGDCVLISCFLETNSGTANTLTQILTIPSDRFTEIDASARALELRWLDQTNSALHNVSAEISFLNASAVEITNSHMSSPALSSVDKWAGRLQMGSIPVGTRQISISFVFNSPTNLSQKSLYLTGITARLVGRDVPQGSINLLTSVDDP